MWYKSLFFSITLLVMFMGSTLGQFFPQNSPVHQAVLRSDEEESRLPAHLMNPFYKSPRVRQALARASWFGSGEKPVYEREAEKIPRHQIYNVLTHAGLVPRKQFF